MFILDVAHTPGRHCASTGIKNIVNYHGIPWSEAMCFGIGTGLGIWYLNISGNSPERLVHVRSEDIEYQFFSRIGYPFSWRQYDSAAESEADLIKCLHEGKPVIVQTDIYHLSYFNTQTHFPGHVITVWGYDQDREVFFISDTEREEIIEVSFTDMRQARFSNLGFFNSRGNLFAPHNLRKPDDLGSVISKAIVANSSRLLNEDTDFQGIKALKTWLKELPRWDDFKEWKWVARFTYQVIEKRGTGGGGFRKMYADFLAESADLLPQITALGLNRLMREASVAWQALAIALKEASEKENYDGTEIYDMLNTVKKIESDYHQKALRLS